MGNPDEMGVARQIWLRFRLLVLDAGREVCNKPVPGCSTDAIRREIQI
jgi:hypothetical protein